MKQYIGILILALASLSCSDYLDVEPVGKVIPKTVQDYRSFLNSAYNIPTNHKILTTYRTDELQLDKKSPGVERYKDIFIWNDGNSSPQTVAFPYANFYRTIFYTNHVIGNAADIQGNKDEVDQLVGEAYALRALKYFDLINLYGKPYDANTASSDRGVPITTEYDSEQEYPVATVQAVYDLILSDLDAAQSNIKIDQQETDKVYRFSTLAVKTLRAHVFLYQEKWELALKEAEEALKIKSTIVDLNEDDTTIPSTYNTVESILAIDIVSSYDISNNAHISEQLIKEYDTTNDRRFSLYYDKRSNGRYLARKNADIKYKCTFRTSDLHLLRAEALARLGKLDQSKKYMLEFAKHRYTVAGMALLQEQYNRSTQDEMIENILLERKREFAIEGKRWNDMRRSAQGDIKKYFDGKEYTLTRDDERYVIPFPREAVINNPLLR